MTKFRVGEKVIRTEEDRLGIVVKIYSDYESWFGPYPELYEVKFNGGLIERGFLPHGLERAQLVTKTGKPRAVLKAHVVSEAKSISNKIKEYGKGNKDTCLKLALIVVRSILRDSLR